MKQNYKEASLLYEKTGEMKYAAVFYRLKLMYESGKIKHIKNANEEAIKTQLI